MRNLHNKVIMQRHFIEAVWKIWEEEGREAVSTRKLAKVARYNVATMYHYFDNLDQIIFFASIHLLKEYAADLPLKTKGVTDPALLYIKSSECFNQHVFRYPHAYRSLFINHFANEYNSMLETYYKIFPEEIPEGGLEFYPLVETDDLHLRDYSLLLRVAESGEIALDDVAELAIANTILVKGMLLRYLAGSAPHSYDEAVKETTKMQVRVLIGYGVNKEKFAKYL